MFRGGKYIKIFLWTVSLAILLAGSYFGLKCLEKKPTYKIPISMALDDGYTYPTIVAMTSMLENKNDNAEYDYYIMHPGEFSEGNKEKIKSLEKKYSGCKVEFIDMGDKYKDAYDKGCITTPTYYRLSLSELLPDVDKIIWLDGDTLTFSDLKEMYDIDMEGYYYKGFLDFPGLDDFAKDNDHYICAGVMLINLKELRENDMVNKFIDFIKKNYDRLERHDQTTINAMCSEKIGVLPAKFGIFNFRSIRAAQNYSYKLICENKYTEQDLAEAYKNPVIVHVTSKPWKNYNFPCADKWWKYAEKTDFYEEIKEKYPIL